MKQITITFPSQPTHSYDISIGNNLLSNLSKILMVKQYSKIVVITDENVGKRWRSSLLSSLPSITSSLILPPGEKAKTIDSIQIIWKHLHDIGCNRKSLMINLGGGAITDMGGFAAATYMRGIDFINIPTTLLSQVDASVGGKTGIDFNGVKNLIGTFTQPKAVIIDVATLATLPKREFTSGFAEIIKHGLIKDKNYFEKVNTKHPLEFTQEELIEMISRSCEIKAQIVQSDETESEQRKMLNFGHTIGHAIEALSFETDNPLLHGEAISIGIAAESDIATRIGLLTKEDAVLIKKSLNDTGLPTIIPHFKSDDIIEKMKLDKKNAGRKINFTLLKQIGEGVINQTVNETVINEALKYL